MNQGCLGFHVWPNHAATPEVADELRIDLDPSPGIELRAAAGGAPCSCSELLDELGIEVHIKTSGSRGLHLYVGLEPRWDSYEVRAAAVALARELERRHPDLITAQWWKEERGTRVFVDFNQNAPHKTVFGAWCVRPRVGGQVSTPITLGRARRRRARRAHDRHRARPGGRARRPVGGQVRPPAGPRRRCSSGPRRDLADGLMDAPWPPVYPKMPNEPPRVAPSRGPQADLTHRSRSCLDCARRPPGRSRGIR